jgi:hypothetical protein
MGTPRRRYTTRSNRGLTSPCKFCRRRIRPELLDETFLCKECKNDPAGKWLAAQTSEKPATTNGPARHKQGMRRQGEVYPVTIRRVEPINTA